MDFYYLLFLCLASSLSMTFPRFIHIVRVRTLSFLWLRNIALWDLHVHLLMAMGLLVTVNGAV